MPEPAQTATLIDLTTDIVSAYVANNSIDAASLPTLIAGVHAALGGVIAPPTPEAEPLDPAVPIRKSVTPDYIICLEDGRRFKSLKRYLATQYGLTPEQYRAKWGLPADYPMTAPNYAKARSELAKSIGLGLRGRRPAKPAGKKG